MKNRRRRRDVDGVRPTETCVHASGACGQDILTEQDHLDRLMKLARQEARRYKYDQFPGGYDREDREQELLAFAYGAGLVPDNGRKITPGMHCSAVRRCFQQYMTDVRTHVQDRETFGTSSIPTTTDREDHIAAEEGRHAAELEYLKGERGKGGGLRPAYGSGPITGVLGDDIDPGIWYPDPPMPEWFDDLADYVAAEVEWTEMHTRDVAAENERHARKLRKLQGPIPPSPGLEDWIRDTFTDTSWRAAGKRRLLAAVLWQLYTASLDVVAIEGGGVEAIVRFTEQRSRDLRSLSLVFRKLRHGESLNASDRKHWQRHTLPSLHRAMTNVHGNGEVFKHADGRRKIVRNHQAIELSKSYLTAKDEASPQLYRHPA